MNHAYDVSDQKQLADTRAELAVFTSELKASGLAAQSVRDKWSKLIDLGKELFYVASIIRTIFVQVKQSVSTFLELDTSMTNLYKVSEDISSRDQFSGLLTKWNKLAQKLAVTTTSLINSAAEWSKMGFNLEMSEQLAQITAIFEKTAEITNEKASSTLISAAQTFTEIDDLNVEDYVKRVEAIGNKINAIGNQYSISSEGIADGLQNASAALKMAGNDLNETISLITATNKIFQSPEEGSNMLKVASMRLRGQVDALKEMGEDAEGVSTDLTKIQQQIYELTGNKVNIFEDDENLKSTYQMILEIGEVFDKLGDRQQVELLEVMFGKQRASAGVSLLLKYHELEQIKNDSMNAANSMAEEYSKYMESAEAHIPIFKERLTETYSTFMSGDLIKYTADVGSALLDLVNSTDLLKHGLIAITTLKVGQGISSLGAVIVSTVKQMNTLGSAIQQVKNLPLDDVLRESALNKIGDSTKNLTEKNLKLLLSQKQLNENDKITILTRHKLNEEEAAAKLEKLELTNATKKNTTANIANATSANVSSVAFKGLAASIRNVWTAMSLVQKASIIIAGLSTAWTIASTAITYFNNKEKERQEAIKESINTMSEATCTYSQSASTLDSLTEKYKSLRKQLSNTNLTEKETYQIKSDLYDVQRDLIENYGYEAQGVDLVNGKYEEQLALLQQINKEKASDYLTSEKENYNKNIEYLTDTDFTSGQGWYETWDSEKYGTMSDALKEILAASELSFYHRIDEWHGRDIDYYYVAFRNVTREEARNLALALGEDLRNAAEENADLMEDPYYDLVQTYLSHVTSDLIDVNELNSAIENADYYEKLSAIYSPAFGDLYNSFVDARNEYLEALQSGEGVGEAKVNFDNIYGDFQNSAKVKSAEVSNAFEDVKNLLIRNL